MIVGITGGIASGKSLVAKYFRDNGITVINADTIGHEILLQEDVKKKIISRFGDSILKDGNIDRKKLGKIVFEDIEKLRILNAIVHPVLIQEIFLRIDQCADSMVVIDAALLFQWNMNEVCTYVILVTAPKKVRISRLEKNNHLTHEEAEDRINAQQEFPEKLADFIIRNDGTLRDLYKSVGSIWEKLQKAQK